MSVRNLNHTKQMMDFSLECNWTLPCPSAHKLQLTVCLEDRCHPPQANREKRQTEVPFIGDVSTRGIWEYFPKGNFILIRPSWVRNWTVCMGKSGNYYIYLYFSLFFLNKASPFWWGLRSIAKEVLCICVLWINEWAWLYLAWISRLP